MGGVGVAEISTAFHVTGAGAGSGGDAGGGLRSGGGDRAAAAAREYEPALRSCLDALRKMQSFNNLAREGVPLVELGGVIVD